MKQLLNDVAAFQLGYGAPCHATLQLDPPDDRMRLRMSLVTEENSEFLAAHGINSPEVEAAFEVIRQAIKNDPIQFDATEVADAIADDIYVLVGSALEYGIPLDKVWDEVQDSNMKKFPNGVAVFNDIGKLMKPADWKPPDVASAIERDTDAEWAWRYRPAAPARNVQARIDQGWLPADVTEPEDTGYYWVFDDLASFVKAVWFNAEDRMQRWSETDVTFFKPRRLPVPGFVGRVLTDVQVQEYLYREAVPPLPVEERQSLPLRERLLPRAQQIMRRDYEMRTGKEYEPVYFTGSEVTNGLLLALIDYIDAKDTGLI